METHRSEYLRFERSPLYIAQVEQCEDQESLRAYFSKRIAFGTAGLRGPMRAGINAMNCGTVWRASQGLCQFWLNRLGNAECVKRGAVVGYDGRHESEYLASVTAAVFMSRGIPVYFADEVTATPITPYLIVRHNCFCGVQVTASHNPKNDNGYKVYADNGAQIIPPLDKAIADEIENAKDPWAEVDAIIDHQLKRFNPIHPARTLARFILSEDWANFKKDSLQGLLLERGCLRESKLKVVYTAMHGVGYRYVHDLLTADLEFPESRFIPVPQQMYPDPEFPTVKFPNPEERGALEMAKAKATEVNADLIIANDPDADRFAAAERQKDGTWRMFTGDELGSLLGMIAYENWTGKVKNSLAVRKCSLVCSAVSASFLKRFALAHPNAIYRETLTGFKWLINVALDMKAKENIEPCFCYEEALGYGLCVDTIPDKCGLTAAAAFVAKASQLQKRGEYLGEWLNSQMEAHGGFYATENSYYVAESPQITKAVMSGFRDRFGDSMKRLADGESFSLCGYEITRVRDLGRNFDSATGDQHCELPAIDDMLTIEFKNGSRITLRGSGTEPKLKYYSEYLSSVSIADAKKHLANEVQVVLAEILKPQILKHASEL